MGKHFKASLVYTARSCLKKQSKTKQIKTTESSLGKLCAQGKKYMHLVRWLRTLNSLTPLSLPLSSAALKRKVTCPQAD